MQAGCFSNDDALTDGNGTVNQEGAMLSSVADNWFSERVRASWRNDGSGCGMVERTFDDGGPAGGAAAIVETAYECWDGSGLVTEFDNTGATLGGYFDATEAGGTDDFYGDETGEGSLAVDCAEAKAFLTTDLGKTEAEVCEDEYYKEHCAATDTACTTTDN